ncbi:MAG TPA: carbohydrate ABC transporter permease [Firmicutes bacterium]|nr:carbohydrate ABC transporter permease [Bacillota bacterium]
MENVLKIHISRRAKKITMRTVTYVGCIVLAIFFIFPLLWMIVTSTKTEMQYANDLGSFATFLPNVSDLSTFFDNYLSVLTEYDIWKYALNSLGYAAAVVVCNIIVNALAGYVMAKFTFPGKGFISFLIMFLLIVPVETTIIPLYSIVHNLGISGTVLAVILPAIVSVFNIFLFQQFFTNIPKEYIEAAQLDGANQMKIFFIIMMPLSAPIVATVATFAFIGVWNDYIWPTMVLPSPQGDEWPLYPIQAALTTIQSIEGVTTGEVMASLVVTSIPIFLVYVFAQKYIVEGISVGGLKL